jgi:hypothetical protein
MLKRAWVWIVAAVAAVAGVVLAFAVGRRKTPVLPLIPPAPVTPPVEKPLVNLQPADDFKERQTPAAAAPAAVIARINTRHGGGQ